MKVSELIAALQKVDSEREVILQRDPEGNGYSPLESFWEGAYDFKYGYAGLEKLEVDDIVSGWTEDDVITDGQKAIFLYPRY